MLAICKVFYFELSNLFGTLLFLVQISKVVSRHSFTELNLLKFFCKNGLLFPGNTTDSADTTSSPSVFSQISLNSSNRVIPAKSENNVENQKHGPPKPTKTKKKEDRNGRKSSSVMDSTWNTSLPSYLLGTQKMSPAGGSFNDVRKNGQDLPYHMCPHCCLTFADLQPFQDHMKTHSESGNAIERVVRFKYTRCSATNFLL